MTKIIFITSGKIQYELPGYSLYESISRVAAGVEFPHLVDDGKIEVHNQAKLLSRYNPVVIYTAPSFQAKETADILGDELKINVEIEKNLLPLKFNLKNLVTKNQFNKSGELKFSHLRKRFLEDFFENKLLDKNAEVKKRFESLKKIIESKYKNQTVIVVSHAYLIKLFSIYYEIGDRMFTNKDLLFKLFKPEQEPLGRLQTLIINI